ncbi:uncharacterized protein BcabD6B2_56670 [Babesia caballi]|uniref:Uncharacterized protein n=1 Tax=Babesia caballi TaxID=5871 RepID=A0AAV4M2C5_BABCB|nr:hypothetical protein, conserved [Babesia caballi]
MISKTALFNLVREALRRNSLRSFEHIQDSFDHHLRQSLTLIDASSAAKMHVEEHQKVCKEPRRIFDAVKGGPGERRDHVAADSVCTDLGIDFLKPFEIVMGFQLLDLACSSKSGKWKPIVCHQKLLGQLDALMWLAWHRIEGFSFVKLALLLNSLANIIHSGSVGVFYRNTRAGGDGLRTTNHPTMMADNVETDEAGSTCGLLQDEKLRVAFERFHVSAESRLMVALLTDVGGKSTVQLDESLGSIDGHSICMVLKYYVATGNVGEEVLYCIWQWLRNQREVDVTDLMNMVVSVSRMKMKKLFERVDLDRIDEAVKNSIKQHLSGDNVSLELMEMVKDCLLSANGDGEPKNTESVVELLLMALLETECRGNAKIELLHHYTKGLAVLDERGVRSDLISSLRKIARGITAPMEGSGDVTAV